MQATNSQLTDFIGASKQYFIPVFQREYSWDREDCIKLLSDIIDVANDLERPCHFLGSIIYLPKTQFASTINECAIIDGQQRLTTISLLFLALAHYSESYYANEADYNSSETNLEQIKDMYLINRFGKMQLRYKLRLNGIDNEAYKYLLDNGSASKDFGDCRIFNNYKYMLSELKARKIDPATVLNGIHKLLLVDIPLNREDNAQLVFETVNSTGKVLTETQKIKNYILMTVAPEDQDDLYENYWHPMEKALGSWEFDLFFRYYLTIKNKEQISIGYYNDFKKYARKSGFSTIQIVHETKLFFDLYIKWREARIDSPDEIYRYVYRIKATKQDKITPTILQILFDVQKGKCQLDQAKKVLLVIESYFMRRKLCLLPTNTAGSVCFIMLKSLGKTNYADDFIKIIYSLTYAQRMPTDEELTKSLRNVPVYGKAFDRYVLDTIEKYKNKDYVHLSTHSIEHIMPQTVCSHDDLYSRSDLSDEQKEKTDWAEDLGTDWKRIHSLYVNTIGNLTLTGYNSEYKNYRFKYKRDMVNGYASSPIRITSETLSHKQKWGEEDIIERSDWMSAIISEIWKYPNLI